MFPVIGVATIRKHQLEIEKNRTQREIEKSLQQFHDAVSSLSYNRSVVLSQIKQMEVRILNLHSEFLLLKTYETKDNSLLEKQEKASTERQNIESSLVDIQTNLQKREKQLAVFQKTANDLLIQFDSIVPPNNPHRDHLLKLYKKKIKRQNDDDDSDWDSDEEEEEEWDSDEEEEEEDEELEDVCPIGCDPALFDQMMDLRETKTDLEVQISQMEKALVDLRKSHDRLVTRRKQVEKDLKGTSQEIRTFQTEKLKNLNQIQTVLPLKLHQIYCYQENGSSVIGAPIPTTTTANQTTIDSPSNEEKEEDIMDQRPSQISYHSLVQDITLHSHSLLPVDSIEMLGRRITELQDEIGDEKVRFKVFK